MRIALGFDSMIEAFADQHEAQTWHDWGDGENWRARFYEVASDEANEIYWNLTGVNMSEGLLRASRLAPGAEFGGVDWELLQFRHNESWLARTTWFRDGQRVEQPPEMTP